MCCDEWSTNDNEIDGECQDGETCGSRPCDGSC